MNTRAKVTVLSILLTLNLLGLTIQLKSVSASPALIVVPSDYPTIQEAITHANTNDTILVLAGTYRENLAIDRAITLMGSGKNITFIKASNSSKAVIEITGNNASISGFTIQGGLIGVRLSGSNFSLVSNNALISNTKQGIALEFSHGNKVSYNIVSSNGFEGVRLGNSTDNLISNNAVTLNQFVGIELSGSTNNRINNNTVAFHDTLPTHDQGIWVDTASDDNTFDGNTIYKNAWGADIYSSRNNLLYHNNFVDNVHQAERDDFSPSNAWDNSAEGNYWSDYAGVDVNPPFGIGDTPYSIGATGDRDNFPLMNQWNPPTDNSPPITVDNYDGAWHNINFTITLTVADDFSGIQATYYKTNNEPTKNVNTNGQPYITNESAHNRLEYWSVDVAGHEETPHHFLIDIKLDKTMPQGSEAINNGDAYTTLNIVTLNLSANDALSGIFQMRFSNNGTVWSPWEPFAKSKTWNLPAGDGVKNVYTQFQDNALLTSQTYDDSIILDTSSPSISILSPSMNAQFWSSTVTVEWNGIDEGVGIDHFEVQLDDVSRINVETRQTYTFGGLSDGNHVVKVIAFDKLSRSQQASVSFSVNASLFVYIVITVAIVAAVIILGIAMYFFKIRKRKASATALVTKKRPDQRMKGAGNRRREE